MRQNDRNDQIAQTIRALSIADADAALAELGARKDEDGHWIYGEYTFFLMFEDSKHYYWEA